MPSSRLSNQSNQHNCDISDPEEWVYVRIPKRALINAARLSFMNEGDSGYPFQSQYPYKTLGRVWQYIPRELIQTMPDNNLKEHIDQHPEHLFDPIVQKVI